MYCDRGPIPDPDRLLNEDQSTLLIHARKSTPSQAPSVQAQEDNQLLTTHTKKPIEIAAVSIVTLIVHFTEYVGPFQVSPLC